MNKKAFTMIELIAIVVIMASMLLIILPSINNTIKKSEENKKEDDFNNIYMAAENFLMDNYEDYKIDNAGNTTYIYITDLINNNYMNVNTLNPNNNESFTDKDVVKITRNEDKTFNYELTYFRTLYDIVQDSFPYLDVGENGCKNLDENNYSYMGGCYLKGGTNNNYLWYSGFLWRIMGINADGTIRIITEEPVTAISFGKESTANTWDNSYQKKWLNDYFLSNLINTNDIVEQTWCTESTTDKNSARSSCSNDSNKTIAKVGMITLDEYNLSGGSNSYLNINFYYRTMTPGNTNTFWELTNKNQINESNIIYGTGCRAIINLKSDLLIASGNGILNDKWDDAASPYVIMNSNLSYDLSNKSTSGEYVLFSNKMYRVVDKDSNNNVKLVLDDFYTDSNDEYLLVQFLNNGVFSSTTGIGQILNTDVYNWLIENDKDKEKIVNDYTWYQNVYNTGTDYEQSLEEENAYRSAKSTVGLLRIGEMMSSQVYSVYTKKYTVSGDYNNTKSYWLLNYWNDAYGWELNSSGGIGWPTFDNYKAIRPVIVIKSNTKIISGDGTWSNPYQI